MARNKYPEETVKLILDAATRLFMEKGYEHTSIQDIIGQTGLSKGAIYHHFASKEEIFERICDRIGQENVRILNQVRDNRALNGLEKLRAIFRAALNSPHQDTVVNMTPFLLDNPKFLAMQIRETLELVAPDYIEPILRQGMEDGSIPVQNPRALAEAIMFLSSLWMNPLLTPTSAAAMAERCQVFEQLLRGLGLDLLDEEMIHVYVGYCAVLEKRRT